MTSAHTIDDFEQIITAGNKPFEAMDPLGGPSARVRFTGLFNREKVLWNAHVMTMEAVIQDALEQDKPPPTAPRQFIEIGADGIEGRRITIGLHVPVIDEPTIWKTVTMIRKYKRLRLGRIEWGQGPDPQPDPRPGVPT